jgi:hypothetical protein
MTDQHGTWLITTQTGQGNGETYVLGGVPLGCVFVIRANVGHQTKTLSDHVLGKRWVLLAHGGGGVGESAHQLKSLLSCRIAQFFFLDDADAKFDQVVEESFEHPRSGFGQISQSNKGRLQVLRVP